MQANMKTSAFNFYHTFMISILCVFMMSVREKSLSALLPVYSFQGVGGRRLNRLQVSSKH